MTEPTPTWAARPMFSGRRVAVSHGPAWNDIYIVDHEAGTATFTGHQMPEVGHAAPLYDCEHGYIDDQGGVRTLHVTTSGPYRGRIYLVDPPSRW